MQVCSSSAPAAAAGVRSSPAFDWSPEGGAFYFADLAKKLGDNQAWDELNMAGEAGQDFGFPLCHRCWGLPGPLPPCPALSCAALPSAGPGPALRGWQRRLTLPGHVLPPQRQLWLP
jgi:hypothetical protein